MMSGHSEPDEEYFKFQERFNQAVAEIKSNKCTNTILLNRAEYENLIKQVKIAKTKERKRSPNDYKRLKRYDVIEECGTERLISPIMEDDVGIRYFVHVGEIFDILHQIHLQLDHGGRVRMEHQLTGKYNNITKELITLYLKLCEICQKRNRGEGDFVRKTTTTNHPKLLVKRKGRHLKQRDIVILKTEKAVVEWLEEKTLGGQQVSDRELRDRAIELYTQVAEVTGNSETVSHFKASKDWLFRFREKFHLHMNSRQRQQQQQQQAQPGISGTVPNHHHHLNSHFHSQNHNHNSNSSITALAIVDEEAAAAAIASASASSRSKFNSDPDDEEEDHHSANSFYSGGGGGSGGYHSFSSGVQVQQLGQQLIDPSLIVADTDEATCSEMNGEDVEDNSNNSNNSDNLEDDDEDDDEDGSNWNYRKFSEVFEAATYLTNLIGKYDPNPERSQLISANVNHNLRPYREMFDILKRHERKLCINVSKRIKQQQQQLQTHPQQTAELKISAEISSLVNAASFTSPSHHHSHHHHQGPQRQNSSLISQHQAQQDSSSAASYHASSQSDVQPQQAQQAQSATLYLDLHQHHNHSHHHLSHHS